MLQGEISAGDFDAWLESVLATLSVEEKAALTAGTDVWSTAPCPALGLRTMWLSDGPNGVRGRGFDEREASYCTPSGSALAATWDADLVRRVGEVVGRDARRKEIDVVLGPTVNLHRSPLGGRGFECYSEDPYLTAELAVAWVTGVQSLGVAATAKHFVANDSETERHTADMVVDQRALRELYLAPFSALVAAGVLAAMTAYNKVNGTYASEQVELVRGVLKGEWGFDGLVMSDWFGTNDTLGCARGGLDLEMPGPGRFFGPALAEVVSSGAVEEAILDDKVRRIARLAYRVGALACAPPRPPVDLPDDAAERRVLRRASASAMTLLRNEGGLLPLAPAELERVAVIGPHALFPAYHGGGSAQVALGPTVLPLDAIRAALPDVEVVYEPGCTTGPEVPFLHTLPTRPAGPTGSDAARAGSPRGMTVEYFDNRACTGPPRLVEERLTSRLVWLNDFPLTAEGITEAGLRLRGTVDVARPTRYELAIRGCGEMWLHVDGREVLHQEDWDSVADPMALLGPDGGVRGTVELGAGTHTFVVTAAFGVGAFMLVEARGRVVLDDDAVARAAQAAADADVAVVLVGTTEEVETETRDRSDLALPGRQSELVAAVAEANPRTVVVVHAGMAVDLTAADAAPTLLYGWFGGQEVGPALADVLVGSLEPSGRLPFTIAAQPSDYRVYSTQPDAALQVHYAESLSIGYRHFDTEKIEPAFPFGHGLGYGEVAYGDLRVEAGRRGGPARAWVTVTNVGRRATKEIVQLYLSDRSPTAPRPAQELVAFAAVQLEPGRSEEVELPIAPRAFCVWDPAQAAFVESGGVARVSVGRSSRDLRASAELVRP